MSQQPPRVQSFPRARLINLIQTALAVGEPRYARRAALAWLAAYPGDLPVCLLHARALLQEGHTGQALPIAEGLCLADPEYREAQELLSAVRGAAGAEEAAPAACSFALGGKPLSKVKLPEWGTQLRRARQSLIHNELEKADKLIHQSLKADPPTPLAAIYHLRILMAQQPDTPILAIRNLVKAYHDRWPGCIFFMLVLAATLMETGDDERAVTLLHQSASQDLVGQVAERLWGADHPYRSLWPERLELGAYGPTSLHEIPIPARVAAALGQNLLPEPGKATIEKLEATRPSDEPIEPCDETLNGKRLLPKTQPEAGPAEEQPAPANPGEGLSSPRVPETLLPIQAELEKVAARLNQPSPARADGRYPVYVVFSTRRGLEAQYGPEASEQIEAAMKQLAATLKAGHDWDALTLLADDPQYTTPFGLQPAAHNDAWGLKLLLVDLDARLAKRGEMIGALLIVGGPAVVPFHHLPNPVDDTDTDVPSDNPYGTRDENYFIPEWPVGRLPGDASSDGRPLLKTLNEITAGHQDRLQHKPGLLGWWEKLVRFVAERLNFRPGRRLPPNVGYTAAIWRRASLAVYRLIGEPRSLWVSPPIQAESAPLGSAPVSLGYFNLHGIPDSEEWFGQRDPTEPGDLPDYPVALRPQDIQNSGHAPKVVFSEACYGTHILDKTVEQALSLKFLVSGTQAVVGSTCTSYGSIAMPLIAADLLGRAFWNALRDGLPAGEALRRAKIALAREMHNRQGYLDGEDQKTLISFVLYGDPLAQPVGERRMPKTVLRPANGTYRVKTVCDRVTANDPQPVPPEVLAHVKHMVAQYLPGMADARLQLADEHAECTARHGCPTAQMGNKSRPTHAPHRKVITLSKQVELGGNGHLPLQHHQFARLTLDEGGKLVKLVVSR